MKKQPARLCIAALILSFLLGPYTISTATYPAQKKLKMAENENTTDASQEPPLTSEEPVPSKEPASSEEPIPSEEPVPSEEPLTKIPVRLTESDAEEKTVTLEWDNINGTAEYAVFFWKNKAWKEVNTTQETTETISLTGYGTANTFKICAYDSEQKQLGESAKIKVLIPVKLKNLKTTAYSKTKVKLYWEVSKGANSSQLLGELGS